MADDADVRLAKMRKAMARLRREGREREFVAVAAAYESLKVERMERAEEEHKAVVRARRAAETAEAASAGPWRLPRGFGRSPGAQARDRGVGRREERQMPPGGLSPWRRSVSPGQEQVWRPGR